MAQIGILIIMFVGQIWAARAILDQLPPDMSPLLRLILALGGAPALILGVMLLIKAAHNRRG
jgi:hypothetical protein